MTVCTWCGQESVSDATCDWCKRPIQIGNRPQNRRTELEFLREEDGADYGLMRIVAVVACVGACIALLVYLLRSPEPATAAAVQQEPTPVSQKTPAPTPAGPRRMSQSEMIATGRDFEITSGPGRIKSRPPRQLPVARKSMQVPGRASVPSLIRLERVELSMHALPNGSKQILGKADILNPTSLNVVDFRLEVVWGGYEYSMVTMTGRRGKLKRTDQNAVKAKGRTSVQLVSQAIRNDPGGTPNALRLTAWLDGPPSNSVDEFPLQLGR